MRSVGPGPSIADLQDTSRFELIDTFVHDDPQPFLSRHFHGRLLRSPLLRIYLALNAAALGALALAVWRAAPSFEQGVAWVGGGFFLGYLLTPLHEALHVLAYRREGAPNVRLLFLWKRMVAYAVADRFVAGRDSFTRVALLPSLVLNPLLLAGGVLAQGATGVVLFAMLFLHLAGGSGDFALVAFVADRSNDEVWTYDDVSSKKTFFFRALPQPAPTPPRRGERPGRRA